VVVTRESTLRLKPHSEPVHHAAEMLGLPPERCVMIGDMTVDVKAAKKAGTWAIGVLCGFGERAELEAAGADLILDSTAELPHWLVPQSPLGAGAQFSSP
jgi:phosphoglycolate phosphatase-like HAD superfamily hydrolase